MAGQWEQFFASHAPFYDQNGFAQHTVAEVDFFLSLYAIDRGAAILDVGCGTGRHSIALARRGFRATGLDLSEAMLAQAKSKSADLDIEWVRADATAFTFDKQFDAAICLCEGAVGLIEKGEDAETHDSSIFRNVARSLRPNAPFLLTCLNGYRPIREMTDQHIVEGRFDPATMVANYDDLMDLPEGQKQLTIYERLFIPPEVVRMLREAGFVVDHVFGGTAGYWGRRPLQFDDIEAMYVCRRAARPN